MQFSVRVSQKQSSFFVLQCQLLRSFSVHSLQVGGTGLYQQTRHGAVAALHGFFERRKVLASAIDLSVVQQSLQTLSQAQFTRAMHKFSLSNRDS